MYRVSLGNEIGRPTLEINKSGAQFMDELNLEQVGQALNGITAIANSVNNGSYEQSMNLVC